MANENAVQKVNEGNAELIKKAASNITSRLPKGVDPTRFMLGIMTAIQKNPALKSVDPNSLLLAAYDAAECGCTLSPALAQGWLIPYGKEVQFQPSYRFFMQKAFETGEVKAFFAEVVYKEDMFERQFAPKRILNHGPQGVRTKETAIGAYAFIEFSDGMIDWEFLTSEQIDRHRKKSKAQNSMKWVEFWEEGWRITPIRVLSKRLPLKGRGIEQVVELANRSEENELDLTVSIPAEPSMPQQRTAPTPIDAKEKEKPKPAEQQAESTVIDGEIVEETTEKTKDKTQNAQTQEMFASEAGGEDPIVDAAAISAFWSEALKAGGKKSEVDKYIAEHFKAAKIKDLRTSQLQKLHAVFVNGE